MSVTVEIPKSHDDDLNQLWAAFPNYNVLVWHNQKSQYHLKGARHDHFEVTKTIAGTYGYEIVVFEMGSFTLEGSQDPKEWGWRGCKDDKNPNFLGPHIEFCNPNPNNATTRYGQGYGEQDGWITYPSSVGVPTTTAQPATAAAVVAAVVALCFMITPLGAPFFSSLVTRNSVTRLMRRLVAYVYFIATSILHLSLTVGRLYIVQRASRDCL
ncbi:hypothetical protein PG994_002287 [Apiospora phragmitis]|uniref:Uncharacterized protein n=1 Tax=Apiospora phragmitis TaxID=2905665 RepID=A0ABR1WW07_9PEZI